MTSTLNKPDLFELTTVQMAEGIASGEISVLELAETLLDRIATYDPVVQSFSYIDRERVLEDARVLDEEAKAGKLRGPLHGVPFAVKEQFLLEGVPTRGDHTDPNPPVAPYTATLIERLRDAGALLFGKLYMVGPAGTPPTRNPWNIEHTPGGSSSGSGAAVGARFVPFSLSEQTGGSGIRPAAYCGVSGFKPTFGRNSRRGMFIMSYSHDYPCIIGTTMEDIARVFAVTSGYDELDPTSLPLPPATPVIDVANMKPPKIGVVRNFYPELQEPVINEAIETAAGKLKDAGATVTDVYLPEEFAWVWKALPIMGVEGYTNNARQRAEKIRSGVTPPLKPKAVTKFSGKYQGFQMGALSELIPATYYLQAQRIRRWLRDKVNAVLSDYDAVLMGTTPAPAPKDLTISGTDILLQPWSKLGNPAISIPGGLSPDGLPIGLQLVAPTLADESLLATGAWCESVLGRLPIPRLSF